MLGEFLKVLKKNIYSFMLHFRMAERRAVRFPRNHGKLSADFLRFDGGVRQLATHPHLASLRRPTNFFDGLSETASAHKKRENSQSKPLDSTIKAMIEAANSFRDDPSSVQLSSHPHVRYKNEEYARGMHIGVYVRSRRNYEGYRR